MFRLCHNADMFAGIAAVEDQMFTLDLSVDDALVEDKDFTAIAASERVIRHRKVAHLAEFALMKDVKLNWKGKALRIRRMLKDNCR